MEEPDVLVQGQHRQLQPTVKAARQSIVPYGASIPGEFPHLNGTGNVVRYVKIADLAHAMELKSELVSIFKAWCDMKDAGDKA